MDRTILLVDDEENITSALSRVLRRDGYSILRANSGADGLALLAQHAVGVIVSDQRMPGMTGTEFLSQVKELYPDTMRIVLSGYTELSSVTDAINHGAVYKFLTKPWEDDLLRENIQEAFQHYEMKFENARLADELKRANEELRTINQGLEKLVERKAREVVHNLEVLRVSQEMVELMPMAVIGMSTDGMIVIANHLAHRLLTNQGTATSLLGESADTIFPANLLTWLNSGIHTRDEEGAEFIIDHHTVRCWCRTLGEHSRSRGVLLAIATEVLAAPSPAPRIMAAA